MFFFLSILSNSHICLTSSFLAILRGFLFFIFFSLKLSVSVTNNKYVGTLETGFGQHKNNTYLGFTVLSLKVHLVTSSAYVLPKSFLTKRVRAGEHANILYGLCL